MPPLVDAFLSQPIDLVLLQVLLWVGWIPLFWILLLGFAEVWKGYRQDLYAASLDWAVLAIDVPRMTEQSPKAMENVFASLQGVKSGLLWKEIWFDGKYQATFTFEIVSNEGYIQFLIRTQRKYRDLIEAGIYAQYPDAEISEIPDYVSLVPSKYPDPAWEMWGAELTLKEKSYFPIRTYPEFEDRINQEFKDPLGVILEQLSRIGSGEHFWVQFVVRVCDQDWTKAGNAFVEKTYGIEPKHKDSAFTGFLKSVFWLPNTVVKDFSSILGGEGVSVLGMLGLEAPAEAKKDEDIWRAFKITLAEKNKVEAVVNKISKIGFQCKVRLVYFGKKGGPYKKGARVGFVKGMLLQFTHQNLNGFQLVSTQVPKDDYFWQRWVYTIKQSRLSKAFKARSFGIGADPMILNTEELATLYHFPTINIKAPLVKRTDSRRAEPPVGLPVASADDEKRGLQSVGPLASRPSSASEPPPLSSADFPLDRTSPLFVPPPIPVAHASAPSLSVSAPSIVSMPSIPSISIPILSISETPEAPLPSTPSLSQERNFPEASPFPTGTRQKEQTPAPSPLPAQPRAPRPRSIPPHLRVLFDPTVELEDVHLPPPEETPSPPSS